MDDSLNPEIVKRIKLLEEKYAAMGQNLQSYLDGLLYADYLTYWEYVNLDVLLSLQQPKTFFPDESIFIMYHQITELYFKLCLHAMKQIAKSENVTFEAFLTQFKRMNSYFGALIHSFEIMIDGMEPTQFLQFRMSLLPASGFQSAQYRMVEICATNVDNLMSLTARNDADSANWSLEQKYDKLYWKQGASELATGKKTLTLKQFERKYKDELLELIADLQTCNLWQAYLNVPKTEEQNAMLVAEMKQFDLNVNVNWPLMHYKSAVRYLQKDPKDIAATGGTNWQKYLPPRYQFVIFYPELWTEEERSTWGRKAQRDLFAKK
ncbi:MAG: tryptophan 2,3-dioxygenase family protein [Chitinophagales bacterium]